MVYLHVKNQVITSAMGGIIDINIQSIKTVMDLYEVQNQRDCFIKVYEVFHHFLEENTNE